MIRLHLFGTVQLQRADAVLLHSVLAQPKRTALLAYLAAGSPRGFIRRTTLLGVFWPDLDGAHARNALSKALHHLRRALGKDTIIARGAEELSLASEHFWSDVAAFEDAVAAGDHRAAIALYERGPLLDGFVLPDAAEFDHWVDITRARLARGARTSAVALIEQAQTADDLTDAVDWAKRAVALFPLDEPLLRELLVLLDRAGDLPGAVRAYRELAERLDRELELEPGPETEALVRAIKAAAVSEPVARPPGDRHATPGLFAKPPGQVGAASSPAGSAREDPARARPRTTTLVWGAVLLLPLVMLVYRAWPRSPAPDAAEAVRLTVGLPPGVRVSRDVAGGSGVAVSRDGRRVVVVGVDARGQRLYLRPLDRLDAVPIAGSEAATSPFFSPDGTWIGFFQGGWLRRVPASGGAVVDIAAAPGMPLGASWGADDRIVFGAGIRSGLFGVNAHGGEVEPVTTLDAEAGEVSHRHPELLPDGYTLLFVSFFPPDPTRDLIHAIDLRSGHRKPITPGTSPRYATSGHLLLARGTALLAAPFDMGRLELSGDVVPIVENVATDNNATMDYAVSRDLTLAYLPGADEEALVLVGADGSERVVTTRGLSHANPRFSPDGAQVAFAMQRAGQQDVWVHDLTTGEAFRLTFEGGSGPTWTPDGSAVTFARWGTGLFRVPVDGRGEVELLVALPRWAEPLGWTPDGRVLAFAREFEDGSSCLAVLRDEEHECLVNGSWVGRLSRDGRWLTYQSGDAGHSEVYVTPFPAASGRWQISIEGGSGPAWSADGGQVYYRSGHRLIAARLETSAGLRVLSRRTVLEVFTPPSFLAYDVHPDGATLAVIRPLVPGPSGDVVVVLNWLAEMRKNAPAAGT